MSADPAGQPSVRTVVQTLCCTFPSTVFGCDLGRLTETIQGTEVHPSEAPVLVRRAMPGVSEDGLRFRIEGELGSGGGGAVYAATDRHLLRRVAVKVMHRQFADSAAHRGRFLAEARMAARLDHPGILPIFDCDLSADGRPWFAMRLVEGASLEMLLVAAAQGGEWDKRLAGIEDRVAVLMRVCEAMAFAHDRGIVHQDIKPGNIVLGDYGEVVLIDWGTAIPVTELSADASRMMGTPMYMSPEQARRGRVDRRSDVWCLGATAWQLFTGRLPVDVQDPEHFWELKRQGWTDPLPSAQRQQVPEGLLRILESTLDPEPDRRPADAGALLAALRGWVAGREREQRLDRIAAELAAAQDHPDHARLARLAGECRQLLATDAGDERAALLLASVRRRHARFALDQGDLGLAASIASAVPELPDLMQEVAVQQRHQQALRRRATWSRWLAAAAVVLLVGLGWLVLRGIQEQRAGWRNVLAIDLAQAATMPELLRGEGDVETVPRLVPGQGLLLLRGRNWIGNDSIDGDLRLVCDITWPEGVDGFEIDSHLDPRRVKPLQPVTAGYSAQFGGYGGLINRLGSRDDGIGDQEATGSATLVPGRRYRLAYTVAEGRMRLEVDGQTVLERHVLLPPLPAESSGIAVIPWGMPVILHRIVLDRRGTARRGGALDVPDHLLRLGQPEAALVRYRTLATDPEHVGLAAEAWSRVVACLVRRGDAAAADEAEAVLGTLQAQHPRHPVTEGATALVAGMRWRLGEGARAIALAQTVLGSRQVDVVSELLAAARRVPLADPAAYDRLLALIAAGDPGRRHLDLSDIPCRNLAPLRGLRLEYLVLDRTAVTDLAPLAGMPLRDLSAGDVPITDLGALRGAPLRSVSISYSRVASLAGLAGAPLRSLSMSGTPVTDLGPLAGMPLESLSATFCPIADLSPLRGAPLRNLSLGPLPCRDAAPLAGFPLSDLSIQGWPGFPVAILAGKPLRRLSLPDCGVDRLDLLAGLPLVSLVLSGNRVVDVAPIATCTTLESLNLSGNGLVRMPSLPQRFRTLDLSWNALTDLSFLRGMQVHGSLVMHGNPIRDPTPISDLATLPKTVQCDAVPGTAGYDGLLRALTERGAAPSLIEDITILRAVAAGDRAALLEWAQREGQALYLPTRLRTSRDEARRLAAMVGARLPRVQGVADLDALLRVRMNGHDLWIDGEPPAELHRLRPTAMPPVQSRWLGEGRGWSLVDRRADEPFLAPVLPGEVVSSRNLFLCWDLVPGGRGPGSDSQP